MHRFTTTLIMGALLSCVHIAGCDDPGDDEQRVLLTALPDTVNEAAMNAVPGMVIEQVTRRTEQGRMVYELEGDAGDVEYELDITEDGNVLEIESDGEQKLALSEVPRQLRDAATGAVDGLVLNDAMRKTADGKLIYHLSGAAGETNYEIKVSSTGEVLEINSEEDPQPAATT